MPKEANPSMLTNLQGTKVRIIKTMKVMMDDFKNKDMNKNEVVGLDLEVTGSPETTEMRTSVVIAIKMMISNETTNTEYFYFISELLGQQSRSKHAIYDTTTTLNSTYNSKQYLLIGLKHADSLTNVSHFTINITLLE